MHLEQQQERLGELYESSQALLDKAAGESRSLSEDESKLIATNTTEFDKLKQNIDTGQAVAD